MLGPVLFVCFINDMPEKVISLVHMFADDIKVGQEIASDMDRAALQQDLDSLTEWSSKWQMQFKPLMAR